MLLHIFNEKALDFDYSYGIGGNHITIKLHTFLPITCNANIIPFLKICTTFPIIAINRLIVNSMIFVSFNFFSFFLYCPLLMTKYYYSLLMNL